MSMSKRPSSSRFDASGINFSSRGMNVLGAREKILAIEDLYVSRSPKPSPSSLETPFRSGAPDWQSATVKRPPWRFIQLEVKRTETSWMASSDGPTQSTSGCLNCLRSSLRRLLEMLLPILLVLWEWKLIRLWERVEERNYSLTFVEKFGSPERIRTVVKRSRVSHA